MALGSTQPLTEMSTRNISWGLRRPVRKADNLPPSCAGVTKNGELNFLEHSGPLQACNGTALLCNVHIEGRSGNYFFRGKAISILCSECVYVALGIQHAMRIRHIVLCNLPNSTIFFPTLSHQEHDFRRRKRLLNVKWVF